MSEYVQVARGENKAAEALLTLEGLVVSSSRLSDEKKLDLLEFLNSIRGVSRSRGAMKFALQIGKEEGVW